MKMEQCEHLEENGLEFERTFVIIMSMFESNNAYIEDSFVYWRETDEEIEDIIFKYIIKTGVRLK